jgi:PIN domain nuclease of toxin-antitoxin system
VRAAIASSDRVGVSAMSCFEVVRLAEDGRITLAADPRTWIRHALAGERTELIAVDADVAVAAALLDRRTFPGDPADRVIFASALTRRAVLATKDRRIRAYDDALTVW